MISWATPGTKWVPHIYSPFFHFAAPFPQKRWDFIQGHCWALISRRRHFETRSKKARLKRIWMLSRLDDVRFVKMSQILDTQIAMDLPWTYLPTGPETPVGTCRSEGLQGRFRCRDGTITLQFVQVTFGSD